MMTTFDHIPPELWHLMFVSTPVTTLRLMNKTFLYHFECRFYSSIGIKINKKDIYQVMLNKYNDKYIYTVNKDIHYIVDTDIKMYNFYSGRNMDLNIGFISKIDYNNYIDQFKTNTYIIRYKWYLKTQYKILNMDIDILNRYLIIKNRYGSMYYKYHNIIKEKIIQYIKSENLAIYSSSISLIKSRYIKLLFNTYIFNLITIDELNRTIDHISDDVNILRSLCKDLSIKIITCIKNIDKK